MLKGVYLKHSVKDWSLRDLPRDPVVITWPFYCRPHRLDPRLGTKILHDLRPKEKKREKERENFLNGIKMKILHITLKRKLKKNKTRIGA